MNWHPAIEATSLSDDSFIGVVVDSRHVLISRTDGKVHATTDICPHNGVLLSGGIARRGCITCPGHFWRFDLATGQKQGDPRTFLTTYPTREVQGWIEIDLPKPEKPMTLRDILLASAREKNTPKGLLLDVGVVFFKSAWEIADQYEQVRGLPAGTVVGRGPLDTAGDERWNRYLQGEATEREYWLDFAAKAQANGAPLDGHPTIMRAMFQTPGVDIIRAQALSLVRRAKQAGLRVGILTNELMDFQGRDWVESQDWFPLFDVIVDSSEIAIRKPDIRAYDIAIEAMGLPANEIVFIDDNPTYVQGGLDAGLVSLQLDVTDPGEVFDRARQLLKIDID